MALTPFTFQKKPQGGGGSVGSVIGGILGAIAAPFTGGLTLPVVAGGLGIGSTVGGLAGSIAAPGKAGQQTAAPQSSIAKRYEQQIEPSKILQDSLAALNEAPPEIQKMYRDPLMQAHEMSLGKRQRGVA